MHQMELGPKPVQAVEVQPVDFDPQARWEALEAYLTHEREFWPSEHLGYLTDHLRVRLQAWEEDFRQAEEDRLEKRTVKDISLAGVGSYVRNDDLASYYGFEPDDHCRDPHIVFLIEHGYLGYERDYYAGYYEVVKLLPSKEEFVLTCGGPVKDISLAVVGSIVSEHALEDYYGTRDWRHQMYFKELSGLEKFEDRDYSRTWGHYHCFKIKGPLPSKEEFGPACEAWLKKYDEEREAERARNEAEEVARIAEEDRQEKAALAAETPGTPMHKLRQLRQDVEDSKAKLFEASAKVQSVCEEHRRLEEAERAGEEAQKSNPNTKPKSKAQAKRDEKAKEAIRQGRAKIRGKAHDDEDKARQALADARTAVAAFEVNEIAKIGRAHV